MHGGLRPAPERQGLWAAPTLPGTIWLVLLFLVPFYAIAAVTFGGFDQILLRPLPRWNSLDWQFDAAREVVDQILDTVPMRIYSQARGGATPALNALASFVLFVTIGVIVLGLVVMSRIRRRRGVGAGTDRLTDFSGLSV